MFRRQVVSWKKKRTNERFKTWTWDASRILRFGNEPFSGSNGSSIEKKARLRLQLKGGCTQYRLFVSLVRKKKRRNGRVNEQSTVWAIVLLIVGVDEREREGKGVGQDVQRHYGCAKPMYAALTYFCLITKAIQPGSSSRCTFGNANCPHSFSSPSHLWRLRDENSLELNIFGSLWDEQFRTERASRSFAIACDKFVLRGLDLKRNLWSTEFIFKRYPSRILYTHE